MLFCKMTRYLKAVYKRARTSIDDEDEMAFDKGDILLGIDRPGDAQRRFPVNA